VPLANALAGLLTDCFALQAATVPDAPVDLLPRLFRDLKERRSDPHERVLALLGELMTVRASDAEVEAGCRELHARHDEFQQWYQEDGEPNPFFAERPEFAWGAAVRRSELPAWLELVEHHFPRSPELAATTRERLLHEGQAWLAQPLRAQRPGRARMPLPAAHTDTSN